MSGLRTYPKIRRAVLLCICTALGPHDLAAVDLVHTLGQYTATSWSSRDTFPGGAINAIAQTPDGYLWIGAENGLVRFDGISFRLLDPSNTPSLPPGHVLGLMVDSEGALWVRMESPNLMRYRGGSFEQMYSVERLEQGVTAMARGSGGVVIAANGAPLRYHAGKFTPLVSSGATGGLALSMAETEDGGLWMGLTSGLFCVRAGRESKITGLPDQKVNVLQAGSGPELWIGTDAGVVRWDGGALTRRGIPATLAHSPVLALARDRELNMWVSTSTGIARIDPNGSVRQFPAEGALAMVQAIFEDREGDLWFGGVEGLVQLRKSPFLSYRDVAGEGGSSIYVDTSGRAWIGPTSGGLVWIHGAEHHSITGLGLEGDVIYSICGGPDEVWVGRRSGGVTQLRQEAGGLQQRTFTAAEGLAPGAVYAIHRSRDGTVWAGTLGGAVSRIRKDRITTFTTANGLSADAVTTIEETPDGVIWVGTAGGLEAFRGGTWRRYSGEDGLPPGRVNSLALDEDGMMWVGSSAGLFYWSGTRLESARDTPDLLSGEIYGLAVDDAGNLWAATDRHVVTIPRTSLLHGQKTPVAVREFGTADGLPSTRGIRRDHSVTKDPSGRIWLSLQGGISVLNPLRPAARAPALVRVESVVVDGRPLDAGPTVHYPSSRHRVVFNFIGVSLAVPGRVRYRYLLEGYDHDWSQPTESREVAYTNLPPAGYTFRVMASNSEELWNGSPAGVPFEVEPQMWQTLWFRLIGSCLVGAAIFAGFRYRMARVHAAMNLRFEERLLERTRIARDLHDTLLQSFQGLMLRLQVVDDLLPPGKAKDQLEQTLHRADQAIAEGRSTVYDLRSSTTITNDLDQAVRTLGDELATTDSAAFHLVVEGTARDLHPIIRDELYRITREALRNAFNHAHASHIETEITYGERALRLRIRDDGEGIPPEILEEGRPGHYGLPGMRERARQTGGKLAIWSGAGAGTEIEVSIAGSIAYGTPTGGLLFRLFRKKAG